jgi:hypothetical protein
LEEKALILNKFQKQHRTILNDHKINCFEKSRKKHFICFRMSSLMQSTKDVCAKGMARSRITWGIQPCQNNRVFQSAQKEKKTALFDLKHFIPGLILILNIFGSKFKPQTAFVCFSSGQSYI